MGSNSRNTWLRVKSFPRHQYAFSNGRFYRNPAVPRHSPFPPRQAKNNCTPGILCDARLSQLRSAVTYNILGNSTCEKRNIDFNRPSREADSLATEFRARGIDVRWDEREKVRHIQQGNGTERKYEERMESPF
jgi:hypothetical protein